MQSRGQATTGGNMARPSFAALIGAVVLAGIAASNPVQAQVIGVSWSNFQEERWKTDEAAIKAQLEKLGAKYISADAGGSPEKQLGDIDGL
ncbi:MAG TPA: D-xylose ABC transporter substrate-binding protein, partial [Reyranella sp.]